MIKITINTQATINTSLANSLAEYAYITRLLEELTDAINSATSLEARIANGEELTTKDTLTLETKRVRIDEINELLNTDDISPFVDDCKTILASDQVNDIRTLKIFANLYGRVHVPNCNTNKIYSAFLNYHSGSGTKKELQKALNAFLSILKKKNSFVRSINAKTGVAEIDLFVAFILKSLGFDKRTGMVKINTMSQREFNRNLFIYAVSCYQADKVVLAESESLAEDEVAEVTAYEICTENKDSIKNPKLSLKNRFKKTEESAPKKTGKKKSASPATA